MTDDTLQNPAELRELTVHDRDGQLIGSVEQVYVDDWSHLPEWVTVRDGLSGPATTFVPLEGAGLDKDGVLVVAYTADTVKAAPRENADQHLELDQEQELYVHYGLTPPLGQASGAPGVGGNRPTAPLTGHDEGLEEFRELSGEPAADRPRLRRFIAPESPAAP